MQLFENKSQSLLENRILSFYLLADCVPPLPAFSCKISSLEYTTRFGISIVEIAVVADEEGDEKTSSENVA